MDAQFSVKPSARSLAKGSRAFIVENFEYFKLYIRPLLVPLLISLAVIQISQAFLMTPDAMRANPQAAFKYAPAYCALILIFLFMVYLQACFALSWHRAVLLGAQPGHAVNPFALKPGEGKFIWAFFILGLFPVLLGFAAGLLLGISAGSHMRAVMIVALIVASALVIYGLIIMLRMMFMLPARSVNEQITWRQARQLGRGLVWKLFAAGFWWVLLVSVLSALWASIVHAIGGVVFNQPSLGPFSPKYHSPAETLYLFIFSGVPQMLVKLYLAAFSVGILARLYQWAVQNRLQIAAPNQEGAV